ncbi:hypothetical protein [Bradyrhizobium sp. McL0615]|uniref:hypothetical protein n=1 Tax=Bradyrhizobium sp. McL0615 TaxID=3415673 RepID=UPI003CF980E5
MADEHHIVRHCKKKFLIYKDGEVVGVQPEALELRPPSPERKQETYLSAVHYEHFAGDHPARMKSCCEATPLQPKPEDRLLLINAGLLKRHGTYDRYKVRALHMPKADRKSYAGIHGLPTKADANLNNRLLTQCVLERMPVRVAMAGPPNV